MAKTTSPILSIGAKGQIGKSLVFGTWRGVKYARQLVTPSNPNTSEQQTTRNTFKALSATWKRLGSTARAPFDTAANGRPLTPRNQYTKSNLSDLRGQSDLSNYEGSPGALGGIPPTSLTATTGSSSGEIDIDVGAPSEPTGWTLDSINYVAMLDRDPATDPSDFPVEAQETTVTAGSTNSYTISGLDAGQDYMVSVWTEWTRPDGRTAYGASLTAIQTSTV